MDILKLILIVIVSAIIIVYLQSVNKEIAMIATIFAGGLVLISIVDIIAEIFNLYQNIASLGGISDDYIKIIAIVSFIISLYISFCVYGILSKVIPLL